MERWQARRLDRVKREGVGFDAPAYGCCSFSVEVKRERERAGDKLRFDLRADFSVRRDRRGAPRGWRHARSVPTIYQTTANRPVATRHSVPRSSRSARWLPRSYSREARLRANVGGFFHRLRAPHGLWNKPATNPSTRSHHHHY